MIGGLGKIDLDDWKKHTRLKHCTTESNIVKWFWRSVDEFDDEMRARLLQFVTGSSRVPLQGFKALQGKLVAWSYQRFCSFSTSRLSNWMFLGLIMTWDFVFIAGSTGNAGPRLFTIHQVDANTDNLPKAHTWYDPIH